MKHAPDPVTQRRAALDAVLTLGLGAGAAAVAAPLGAPAPFLTAPALVVAAASLAGMRTALPQPVRDACLVVIGVGMGAGVTPEALATTAAWPGSVLALLASLAAITLGGAAVLTRVFGHARDAALLASLPGHLSYVLAMAERLRGPDLAVMAVIQSLRVLALTLLVPVAVALASDADLAAAPDLGADMAPATLAALLAACTVAGWVARGLGVPAAFLLVAMGVSGALHAGGWVRGDVPAWLAVPAFVVMGTLIGSRFSGVTAALVARAAAAGSVLIGLSGAVAASAALGVSAATGLPAAQTLIAFAPGGLETMAALAVLTGADTAYVATHHAARMAVLPILLPLLLPRRR